MAENRKFYVRTVIAGKVLDAFVEAIDPDMARIVAALEFDMTELPHEHTIREVTDEQ